MLHSAGVTMSCSVCIINQSGPRYEFIRVHKNTRPQIKRCQKGRFHDAHIIDSPYHSHCICSATRNMRSEISSPHKTVTQFRSSQPNNSWGVRGRRGGGDTGDLAQEW